MNPIAAECALIAACFEHARTTGGSTLTFLSMGYADGRQVRFDIPPWFRPPEAPVQPVSLLPTAKYLSRDEFILMRIIADRGPIPAKVIIESTDVERSAVYVLLSNMKDRQVIKDGTHGYEIADRELWELAKAA